MNELNKELEIVHKFIKKLYDNELKSNKIKSEDERLRWAHAVLITGKIAHEYEIKEKPVEREEFYNTIYDE